MTPFFGGVLLLAACGGLVPTHGAVIELDDNSFYNYAKDRDVLLVDFYAPWCSDCKNLEPDFQAAGASLGARSIDLAKVDCFGAGKGLCTKYGVKQWPTLKNFNRGTYTGDYTGGLSAGEIAGYVNTVENSVSSQVVSNPYAAPYTPMVMQTQQCVSRCKISKITNKAPCYAKCKAPKPAVRKMLPQPVINEKSCAKCRQPQIAGKFSNCTRPMLNICDAVFPISSLLDPSTTVPPPQDPSAADINLSSSHKNELKTIYPPPSGVSKAGSAVSQEIARLAGQTNDNSLTPPTPSRLTAAFPYKFYSTKTSHMLTGHAAKTSEGIIGDSSTRALANKTVEDEYGREYKVHHGTSTSLVHGSQVPNSIIQFLNGRKGIDNLMSKLRAAVSSIHNNPLVHQMSPLAFFAGKRDNNNNAQIYHVSVPNEKHPEEEGGEINILQMPGGLLVPFISLKEKNSVEEKFDIQPSPTAVANSTLRKDISHSNFQDNISEKPSHHNDKDSNSNTNSNKENRETTPNKKNNNNPNNLRINNNKIEVTSESHNKTYIAMESSGHRKYDTSKSQEPQLMTSQLKTERKDSSLLNSVIFKTRLNESIEDDDSKSVYDLAIGQSTDTKKSPNDPKLKPSSNQNSTKVNATNDTTAHTTESIRNTTKEMNVTKNDTKAFTPSPKKSGAPQKNTPAPVPTKKLETITKDEIKKETMNRILHLPTSSRTTNSFVKSKKVSNRTKISAVKDDTGNQPINSSKNYKNNKNSNTATNNTTTPTTTIINNNNSNAKQAVQSFNSTNATKNASHKKEPTAADELNKTESTDFQTLFSGKTDGEMSLSKEDELDIFKVAEKFVGNPINIMSSSGSKRKHVTQVPSQPTKKPKTKPTDRLKSTYLSPTEKVNQEQADTANKKEPRRTNVTLANISDSLSTVLRNLSTISPKLTNYSSKLSAAFRKVLNVTKGQELLSPKLANILSQMTNISQRLQAEAYTKTHVAKVAHKEENKRTKVVANPNKSPKIKLIEKLMGYALSLLDVKRQSVNQRIGSDSSLRNETTVSLLCLGNCHDVP